MRCMRTLRALIEAEAPMRPGRAVEIALRVLATLVPMHASGLVHGDVRAERVMLDALRVRMLPSEKPPSTNARDDVAGVASILYELLTRTSPDEGGPASHHTPVVLPQRLVDVVESVRSGTALTAASFEHELRLCLLDTLSQARRVRP